MRRVINRTLKIKHETPVDKSPLNTRRLDEHDAELETVDEARPQTVDSSDVNSLMNLIMRQVDELPNMGNS